MRIVFIAETLDLPESHLIRGLKQAGLHVEVMLDPSSRHIDALTQEGVPTHALTLRRRVDPEGIRRIRRVLKSGAFDIMHTLLNRPLSNGLIASRGLRIKRIAYRGIVGNLSMFNPGSWLTYLNPRIDRIVCVCEAVRKKMLSLRIPPSRLITIYKGHDISWYPRSVPVDLSEFRIPADAYVVGSAAHMRPRKGMAVLMRAAERVAADRPVHYLLVGRIEDKRLERLSIGEATAERIHFTGERRDAPHLMGACDVFVLPSLRREGLARAAMEAMAQQIPAVVTRCGGSPELVRHGRDGLVVAPGDEEALAEALTTLLADADRRREMGISAQRRIQQDFHISRTIRKHLRLYQGLGGR